MDVIVCRSPEQIHDDLLLDALRICDESLGAFIPGTGYVFKGKRRDNLKAVKARVERVILDGETWRDPLPPTVYAVHAMGS